jgi:UV radiation resistance-associated gene protein
VQIPDKEREFPLYFRSKEDVYSKYGVYLLNKNIAQLRWYCGLSTQDLRATLPNLLNLLQTRLTIPG